MPKPNNFASCRNSILFVLILFSRKSCSCIMKHMRQTTSKRQCLTWKSLKWHYLKIVFSIYHLLHASSSSSNEDKFPQLTTDSREQQIFIYISFTLMCFHLIRLVKKLEWLMFASRRYDSFICFQMQAKRAKYYHFSIGYTK